MYFAVTLTGIACSMLSSYVNAAISLDRTRAIINGDDKSISLSISNENKNQPYLAQAWIEDRQGKKISSPLIVLPPVQRVEPGAKSQVKIQASPALTQLPQDRESLFYFNLREIPPRSKTPNTLQIALQTRIKLFYRPKAIAMDKTQAADGDWVESTTLQRQGDKFILNNPSPYFLTVVIAQPSVKGKTVKFKPTMIDPHGQATLEASASELGNHPVLTYINDYGGRPQIQYTCSGNTCPAKLLK